MNTKPENETELRLKINSETARLPWAELQRHFAQGTVVYVSDMLDLVDVAVRISHDDKANIAKWMADGLLGKQQAIRYNAALLFGATSASPRTTLQPNKPQLH